MFNRAAELAFWFLMGFFPMILSVTSMASVLGSGHDSQGILVTYIGKVMPSADFGLLYGSLGTLIVLMFWFYLSGVAILIGGEVNSFFETAAQGRLRS